MSMSEWPAGHNLRHFRALHLVSQPHPGSRHGEPKSFVAVGPRSARHRETLLNEMFVNCNLHCTAPSCCTCRRYEPWSAAEVRSRNGGKRAVDRELTLRSGTKGLRMLVGKTDHSPSKRVIPLTLIAQRSPGWPGSWELAPSRRERCQPTHARPS